MRLFRFELGKLFRLPMLWGFLALSLALNGLFLMTGIHGRPWYTYVASVLPVTFQRTDDPAFAAGLDTLPAEEFREVLRAQAAQPRNVFDGMDAAAVGQAQAGLLGVTGKWADIFARKYEAYQPVADEIAASGDAYDVYAAEATHDYQVFLIGVILHAALTESLLLAVLLTLYAFGCEEQNHTDLLVFSTRAGRALNRYKLAAALCASLLCCLMLYIFTIIPFALLYRLRDFLSMHVSSSFNYILVGVARFPFMVWKPFRLAGYLGASLALGLALVAVFVLGAAVCGLLLRNTYLAFLLWFTVSVGSLALPMLCADAKIWGGYFLGLCLPVPVWLGQQEWFTVQGISTFLPWQETVCTFANLAVFAVLVLLAARRFRRKDLC